jgi:hypothetical protein
VLDSEEKREHARDDDENPHETKGGRHARNWRDPYQYEPNTNAKGGDEVKGGGR